jgi:hypothetical protein
MKLTRQLKQMSWPRAFDIIVGSAHRRTNDIKIHLSSCSHHGASLHRPSILDHSHIILLKGDEPRIGSRVPIRGTFANWFIVILFEFFKT